MVVGVSCKWCFVVLIVIIQGGRTQHSEQGPVKTVNEKLVGNWATEFGRMLFELSSSVTKYDELHRRFERSNGGRVEKTNMEKLLKEILEKVDQSNREKIDAVIKLAVTAQEMALYHLEGGSRQSDRSVESVSHDYWNAKAKENFTTGGINVPESQLYLVDHPSFGSTQVNLTHSTVHVPTSVYEKDERVLDAVHWSQGLDQFFQTNYKNEPTLSWQYFGSTTGFLRQYPGVRWKNTNEDEYDPDLYDCRFRPWYTTAANYPKNMVILYDVSGSMTGLRREIAKHVVSTILDTLTENDYVTVFNFTDDTTPLVPCFGDRLVQANLKNVREFKVALEQDKTAKVANFTTALNKAFDILEKHRHEDTQNSALCNQAIMIITDGAPYHFKEVFDARQDPHHVARVFTYLIGREVTDKREVMWMACAQQGYFVHVTTLGEVQEQVLKYMPVMSRPMVLYGAHNISWTAVYADINMVGLDGGPRMQVILKPGHSKNAGKVNMEDLYDTDLVRVPWLRVIKKAHKKEKLLSEDDDEMQWMHRDEGNASEVERRKRYWKAIFHDHINEDITESDWKWDKRNRGRQMQRSERYKEFARIYQAENKSLLIPFTVNQSETNFPERDWNENDIWIAKERVNEFLTYGRLDATPEVRRQIHAERLRMEIPSNSDDVGHPRVAAITQKKLEIRMKKHYEEKQRKQANRIKWPKEPSFNFMVSVSYPVFDLRNATVIPKTKDKTIHEVKEKVNETTVVGKIEQKRIANFLGVAGTDVHIKDLIRLTSPFKLGANGYAFAVTNNGHIIFHPDWRPILPEDILKPNYNAIDLTEIELVDNNMTFRNNDSDLLEMRRDMVNQQEGYRTLRVIFHQDNFRRVSIRRQQYEHRKMANTSYSLGISLPENSYHYKGEIDTRATGTSWPEVKSWFDIMPEKGRKWKVHPDWRYCDWIGPLAAGKPKQSNEDRLMEFLERMVEKKADGKPWPWCNTKKQGEGAQYCCDRELVSALLFDANVTSHFAREHLSLDTSTLSQFIQMYGVHLAFVSTRSGLTRWIGPLNTNTSTISQTDVKFQDSNIRSIDELWYKRAVERYHFDKESFIFSIPFDAGTRHPDLVAVTASRAIFVHSNGGHAPVAVAGIQFDHKKWKEKFFNTASKCLNGKCDHHLTCGDANINCYVLDDNGYVLISDAHQDHGKFFGEIDVMVMEMLITSDVYKEVKVVDYQATCFHPVSKTSPAGILQTPWNAIKWVIHSFITYLAWFAMNLNIHSLVAPDFSSVFAEYMRDDTGTTIEDPIPFQDLASINKTRLRPCDQLYKLYMHGPKYRNSTQGKLTSCGANACSGFFHVHYIPYTNLILVITNRECRCTNDNTLSIKPSEVIYKIDETVQNLSADNEIVAQICRTPERNPPLYRNRMYNETQCKHYHAEEGDMEPDCGLGVNLNPNKVCVLTALLLAIVTFLRH